MKDQRMRSSKSRSKIFTNKKLGIMKLTRFKSQSPASLLSEKDSFEEIEIYFGHASFLGSFLAGSHEESK